jgi:hypothetical protein
MLAEAAGWRGCIERAGNVEGTLPANFQYDLFTATTAIRRDLGCERISRADAHATTVAWERSRAATVQ